MARDISVELSVEGEQEFNRQLKEAQSAVKVLGSELKASEAQFKGGEDAQERYANRTRILGDQIEQERIIIERLAKAVETAGNEFGQTDAKTDKYRIALNRARENVAKMQKELEKTDREMEELGRDSVRVGRQLEDGIGDSAKKASDDIEEMVSALEADFKGIASSASISAMTDFGGAIVDIGQSIADFAESTRESRRQFGFLEQNAIDAGLEYDVVLDQLKEIQALTGEEDSAIEGISNLLAAGFDERELVEAIDLLGGAVIKFPDTLKFESLADGLQETIATGQATGAYAELLERLGVDIDEFNKAMGEAQTTEEKQQIALAYLNEHGLEKTKEGYEQANQSMVDAESAAFDLNQSMNDLGEAVEPIGTSFTNLAEAVVTAATDIINNTGISEWIAGVLNEFAEAVSIINKEGLSGYGEHKVKEQAEEEEKQKEAAATVNHEAVRRVEELEARINELTRKINDAELAGDFGTAQELSLEREALNLELSEAVREMEEAAKKAVEQMGPAGDEIATTMVDTTKETLTAGMDEAGTDGANALIEAYAAGNDNANTAGQNLGVSLANGIDAARGEAVAAAEETVNQVNRVWARAEAAPAPRRSAGSGATGGQSTGASRSMTVAFNVDGRSFAKATLPYYNAQMGDSLNAIVNA